MNVPRYAAAAAKLLRRGLPVAASGGGNAGQGIATIERALRARSRRSRLVWSAVALASAAGFALIAQQLKGGPSVAATPSAVAIAASPAPGGATIRSSDGARLLTGSARLALGQSVETPLGGGALLRISTGTRLDLAESTSFRLDEQGATERFTLEHGRITAEVAKLKLGQRFIVVTPDAEIEVRGTKFELRVLTTAEGCDPSRTRLAVTEGVVEVRRDGQAVSVAAGSVWPAACVTSQARAGSTIRPEGTLSAPAWRAAMAVSPRASAAQEPTERPATVDPASPLTQQNDLFAHGVTLRRQGDSAGALQAYQELIRRFPRSPLAENALVERMRLLASVKDPQAPTEARRYLARYPRGFAAAEAHQVAAGR